MSDRISGLRTPKPPTLVCAGTGLVALDRLESEHDRDFRSWAGGSCANVLTILSYFGWETYPIARIGNDPAAEAVISDFRTFQVRTDWVFQDSSVNTPIIVERLSTRPDGTPSHRFQFLNADSQTWYPQYRPVLARTAVGITDALPQLNFFYFDRVSRAAIEIAQHSKEEGAIVFFEPSAMKDEKAFIRALEISDIVKYSSERLQPDLPGDIRIPIEVQTLGGNGLRFRVSRGEWNNMTAYRAGPVRDTAGAGDWCSAGLIHALGDLRVGSLAELSLPQTTAALSFGQLLAAAKCTFEGPRSCMYGSAKKSLESLIRGMAEETVTGHGAAVVGYDHLVNVFGGGQTDEEH